MVIQPKAMRPKVDQRTQVPPFIIPMPMTAPITACELETGTRGKDGRPLLVKKCCNPCEANKNKTKDWETTTIQATRGDMDIRLFPTVLMTF